MQLESFLRGYWMSPSKGQQETERVVDGDLIEFESPDDALPRSPADAGTGTSRRRFERVEYTKAVRITEVDDFGNPTSSWECRIVDLSRGGVGIRSRRMVHQGRAVLIEVPGVEGTTKLLYGVVRQCRYAEGEGYAVGVEFKAVPQTQTIRLWLTNRGLSLP